MSSAACKEPTIRLFPRGDGGAGSDAGVVLEELAGAGGRNTSVQTGEGGAGSDAGVVLEELPGAGGRNTLLLTDKRTGLCLAASVDFFVCPRTSSQDIAIFFHFPDDGCHGFMKFLTDMQSCIQFFCLQCFDTVGWASGRASSLEKIE